MVNMSRRIIDSTLPGNASMRYARKDAISGQGRLPKRQGGIAEARQYLTQAGLGTFLKELDT